MSLVFLRCCVVNSRRQRRGLVPPPLLVAVVQQQLPSRQTTTTVPGRGGSGRAIAAATLTTGPRPQRGSYSGKSTPAPPQPQRFMSFSSSSSSMLLFTRRIGTGFLSSTLQYRQSRVVVQQQQQQQLYRSPPPSDFVDLVQWQTARRWKQRSSKGAKLGQHLQKLDEMAHRSEHEAAQERHQKNKERRAHSSGKKSKKGGGAVSQQQSHGDVLEDEQDEEERVVAPEQEKKEDEEEEEEHDKHEEAEIDQTILPDPKEVEQKMQKHVIKFKDYLKGVRGGEPTPELFDEIAVTDAYGKGTGVTPLKAVAQVVLPSPTLAVATCFDPATAKAVANAIREKLELTNPQVDEDGVIRIPLPRVSLESRQNTVRAVHNRAEQFRKRVNQTRNKAITVTKQGMAGRLEHVSKDDAFRIHEAIEKVKDAALLEIDALADKKSDDILKL